MRSNWNGSRRSGFLVVGVLAAFFVGQIGFSETVLDTKTLEKLQKKYPAREFGAPPMGATAYDISYFYYDLSKRGKKSKSKNSEKKDVLGILEDVDQVASVQRTLLDARVRELEALKDKYDVCKDAPKEYGELVSLIGVGKELQQAIQIRDQLRKATILRDTAEGSKIFGSLEGDLLWKYAGEERDRILKGLAESVLNRHQDYESYRIFNKWFFDNPGMAKYESAPKIAEKEIKDWDQVRTEILIPKQNEESKELTPRETALKDFYKAYFKRFIARIQEERQKDTKHFSVNKDSIASELDGVVEHFNLSAVKPVTAAYLKMDPVKRNDYGVRLAKIKADPYMVKLQENKPMLAELQNAERLMRSASEVQLNPKYDVCAEVVEVTAETKGPTTGNLVSHSNIKTRTRWLPNLKRMKAVIDGTTRTVRICARCIRAGKVGRPVKRTYKAESASAAS